MGNGSRLGYRNPVTRNPCTCQNGARWSAISRCGSMRGKFTVAHTLTWGGTLACEGAVSRRPAGLLSSGLSRIALWINSDGSSSVPSRRQGPAFLLGVAEQAGMCPAGSPPSGGLPRPLSPGAGLREISLVAGGGPAHAGGVGVIEGWALLDQSAHGGHEPLCVLERRGQA